ncbi:hypothetical protein KP509_02G081300 [Ceratopteris richardii]|nr:hypothetical protein KP509_02G081300 [Ceratopteris richardii]
MSILRDLGDAIGGIIAGILSDYVPPWALLCFSATCSIVGYGLQWLVVSRTISPLPYWLVCVAATIAGTSISWMNSALFNASVRNFTHNKGPVAGLFKAFMGLSSGVFTILCSILFQSSGSMFLLMLATIPTLFCIICAIFFRPVPTASTYVDEQIENKSLTMFNVIACCIAVYVAFLGFIPKNYRTFPAYDYVSLGILVTIIISPILVPLALFIKMKKVICYNYGGDLEADHRVGFHPAVSIREDPDVSIREDPSDLETDGGGHLPLSDKEDPSHSELDCQNYMMMGDSILQEYSRKNTTLNAPLLEYHTRTSAPGVCCTYVNLQYLFSFWAPEELGKEVSSMSLFQKWHFYVLFVSFICAGGCGLSFSNNLGQIGQALGFQDVGIFITLFSFGNFVGRLAAGIISEYFIRLAGVPRPTWLAVAKIPMIIMYLWLSMGSRSSLYVGSMILGISHGFLMTLSIPIISEFYGLRHFGINIMVFSLYFVSGSYIFSTLAGWMYDHQGDVSYGIDGMKTIICNGAHCYGHTFHIFVVCLVSAFIMDVALSILSKPLYKRTKEEHAHLETSLRNT